MTSNSPSRDYTHPDDRTSLNYDITPGFKPFTILFSFNFIFLFLLRDGDLIAGILELVTRFRIISCSLDNKEAFTIKFLRKAASDVHLGKKSYLTSIETTFPFFFPFSLVTKLHDALASVPQ